MAKEERELDLIQKPYLTGHGDEVASRPDEVKRVAKKTKTVEEAQERVRGRLAQWLTFGAVALIFFFAGATAAGWLTANEVKTLAAVVLSPLVGLAGSATGFYFAQKS